MVYHTFAYATIAISALMLAQLMQHAGSWVAVGFRIGMILHATLQLYRQFAPHKRQRENESTQHRATGLSSQQSTMVAQQAAACSSASRTRHV